MSGIVIEGISVIIGFSIIVMHIYLYYLNPLIFLVPSITVGLLGHFLMISSSASDQLALAQELPFNDRIAGVI